jgi:hypothetical protein
MHNCWQDTVEVSVTKYTMLNPADKVLPFYPNSRDSVSSSLPPMSCTSSVLTRSRLVALVSARSQPTRPSATNTDT